MIYMSFLLDEWIHEMAHYHWLRLKIATLKLTPDGVLLAPHPQREDVDFDSEVE